MRPTAWVESINRPARNASRIWLPSFAIKIINLVNANVNNPGLASIMFVAMRIYFTKSGADLRSPEAFEGLSSQKHFPRTESDFPDEKRFQINKAKS
jgi:hypothetical protein